MAQRLPTFEGDAPLPRTRVSITSWTDVGSCERRQHVSVAPFSHSPSREELPRPLLQRARPKTGYAPHVARAELSRQKSALGQPDSAFSPRRMASLPCPSPRTCRGALLTLSRSGSEVSFQGDCEEICELDIEGHGLLQIYRAGDDYAGRILERVGPFSRTSTVPLFCKGFSDPGEATRALARLPRSALRRRVHVLSDRVSGAERFVFLGDLGLLGGGDREPPSGSGALGRQTAAPSRPKKPRSLISPYIVPHFAGRKEEFGELVEAFAESSESVVVKAVVGPGGIGKTQFATKVFEHLKRKGSYDNEFWIHSDSRESLSAAFLQIAECMEIPVDADTPEPVELVHEKLGGSRCLFVFDDAPNLEMIRDYLPPASGHAVVTTRDTGAGGDWDGDVVRLGQFDECDAWFLAEKFGYTRASHSDGLGDLLDILPPYPLALAQFFSMMEYNEVSSPAEWLHRAKHYAPPRREVEIVRLLRAEHDVEGASVRVYLFNASALMISKEPDGLGTHAIDTLSKLALVDPNGVPVEWMYGWHGPEDGESTTRMQRSLKLLERFSHVSWDGETNLVYIHAETQLLARHLLVDIYQNTSDGKETCEETAGEDAGHHIQAIVDSIGRYVGAFRTDISNRERWASLARNGLPLLEHCKRCDDSGAEMKLVEHMANAYGNMCMFRESLSYRRRGLEMCEHLHGDADHPDLVRCIRKYSFGLDSVGRINEALSLDKRALEMCERLHGDADHPDLILCIQSYSTGLDRVGRINEALSLDKRALEMCERLHGDADHPDLILCIQNYAAGLQRTGRINEALPVLKRALDMCERLYGDADHPDLVGCIRNYAAGLQRTGRDDEALPVFERALEMCERLHGDADHPDLVDCIQNYSSGLDRAGRINEALSLGKRALEMCERLHGDADHPDLVGCIRNYAAGLQGTGRDDEALPVFERALEMCERLHGDADHPDLLLCIQNYSSGLDRVGRINEALSLDKKALEMSERLHGDADHPDLVGCIRNYAIGLQRTGKDDEALPYYEKANAMLERLGIE